jgi:hypothetical protein
LGKSANCKRCLQLFETRFKIRDFGLGQRLHLIVEIGVSEHLAGFFELIAGFLQRLGLLSHRFQLGIVARELHKLIGLRARRHLG